MKIIHTVEIKYPLSYQDIEQMAEDIKETIPELSKNLKLLLSGVLKAAYTSHFPPSINAGILNMSFYKSKLVFDQTIFMKIALDLEALCRNQLTANLFYCTENNIRLLQNKYTCEMVRIFPSIVTATNEEPANKDESDGYEVIYAGDDAEGISKEGLQRLPYLGYCKVSRIDYATNLYTDYPELYLKLAGKSFFSFNKQRLKLDNNNIYATNKSRRISLYNKEARYQSTATDSNLVEEAHNIIRYEAPLTKNFSSFISERYKKYGLLPFLDEEIAHKHLTKEYSKQIGTADWYNDYLFKQRILSSNLSTRNKNTLLQEIAPIISQCRSVEEARKKYVDGTYTIAKTQKIVSGSARTFDKYRKQFKELNLQPLRIPDRDAKYYQISRLRNPFDLTNEVHTEHDSSGLKDYTVHLPDYKEITEELYKQTGIFHQ